MAGEGDRKRIASLERRVEVLELLVKASNLWDKIKRNSCTRVWGGDHDKVEEWEAELRQIQSQLAAIRPFATTNGDDDHG